MLENYDINRLIIGELSTTLISMHGIIEHTEGPYIFYKLNNQEKYIEIFTEDEYGIFVQPSDNTGGRKYKTCENIEFNEFGKTYIKQIESLDAYLKEEEKQNLTLSKKRLVEIYILMREKHIIKNIENRKEEQIKKYTNNQISQALEIKLINKRIYY
jgi:hypothetical protein